MIASAANFQQAAASSQPVSITEAAQADHPAQHSDTASELPEASDGSNGFAVVFAAALQQFASPQYVAAANVDAESGPVPECIADAQTAQEWDAQPRIEIDSFSAAHNASLLSARGDIAIPEGAEIADKVPTSRPPADALREAAKMTINSPEDEQASALAFKIPSSDLAEFRVVAGDALEPPMSTNPAMQNKQDEVIALSRQTGALELGSARSTLLPDSLRVAPRLQAETQDLPEAEARTTGLAAETSGGEGPGRKGSGMISKSLASLAETYDSVGAVRLDGGAHALSHGDEAPAPATGRSAVQKISQAIEIAAQQGRTALEVKLDPPGLGTIIVRLLGRAHGTAETSGMQVEIRALNGEARELIQVHANDLKEALGGWDVKIPNAEPGAASARTFERQSAWNSHSGHPSREDADFRQHRNNEDRDEFAGLINEEIGGDA